MMPDRLRQVFISALIIFSVFALLAQPAFVLADQAQYFYDDLGRLSVAVDGAKNVSVYTYDAVGNLLSITQSVQGSGSIGIYFLSPTSGSVGAPVEIRGFGFDSTPANNQVQFNGAMRALQQEVTSAVAKNLADQIYGDAPEAFQSSAACPNVDIRGR